ncbi:junctional adhesion molecule B isoform X2 [Protopterus annectens]|uniref:junctional adhesion molecule B isoform X2 n=1 Tax=Protopterus annectens TaxID=7888 RepID=UPI001CFA6D89|nr:junctional adhesion molecule B isoform X2 [Protopterus annectens]
MATGQVAFLGFLLGCYCDGALAVEVKTNFPSVEAKEHEDALLHCNYTVEVDPNPRLEWKKILKNEVSFVYYEGQLLQRYFSRAKMDGASIRLRNVTRKDTAEYRCEVSAGMDSKVLGETTVKLTVLVPPAVPMCEIPSSVLTGTVVELTCKENEGTPLSEYHWYKDGILLPHKASNDPRFKNVSFTVNKQTGTLQFNPAYSEDTGKYSCSAENKVGKSQQCTAKYMQVGYLHVGGIVISVVVVAMVIAVCGLGVCYAQRRGYFSKEHSMQKSTSEYKAAPENENDFQHKKSFVV